MSSGISWSRLEFAGVYAMHTQSERQKTHRNKMPEHFIQAFYSGPGDFGRLRPREVVSILPELESD